MHKLATRLISPIFLGALLLPICFAMAQSGEAPMPAEPGTATTSADEGIITPPAEEPSTSPPSTTPPNTEVAEASAPATATAEQAATTTPRAVSPAPASPKPSATPPPAKPATAPAPPPESPPAGGVVAAFGDESPDDNSLLYLVLAAFAVLPFGYMMAQKFKGKETKKEEKKDNSKCFDIKKLLDKKMEELTDLRGKLESEAQSKAREKLGEALEGTRAGDILALAQKAESEYSRLKKLYEECMAEAEAEVRVIIIHGCPSDAERAMNPETRTYDKHWLPWLKKELSTKGIKAESPLMPNPWAPDYAAFKAELEKYPVTKNTILVGHSCGCAFLVRWLGETKKEIAKLILVAPWKIPDANDATRKNFYDYPIDGEIKSRVKEIVMFTSDNEETDGKKSLEIFRSALGGKIVNLTGRGHYTREDIGTEQFPEILEEIKF